MQIEAGAFTLRVDPNTRDLALLRGEALLLDFPVDALELGAVPAIDDATNYDPYAIYAPTALHPAPNGLEWLSLSALEIGEKSADKIALALTFRGDKHATLHIETTRAGSFTAVLTPESAGAAVAFVRLRPRVSSTEGFYGLGEYFDDVNHRGKLRAMQIEIDPELESGYNEAHVPVPFLLGTKGWGLYVDSPFPGVFAVATEKDDRVEATFGPGAKTTEGFTFHLFGAEHPLDLTARYYDIAGYPRLPARWALGPWIWRDENEDQAQVLADVQAIRDLDLATTGYWIDRPYATAVNTFDFEAARFPDPKAMVDTMHDLGLRTALWHTPYLDEKSPDTKALRDEATAQGYYPTAVGVLLNKWGKPVDLTNEKAFAWWQQQLGAYTALGVEGYKLDYGEDVVPGLTLARNVWSFADGSDERTMHGRFQLFYHRVYAETLPKDGGFLLCRHATAGDQVNGPIIWPGDLDASFAHHRDVVTEGNDSYVAVGGLPASLIAGLTLGPSGFPFYGSDTGGYRHSPPDKELFTRWFEQTALSTVMQSGNSSSTVPWVADATTGYDEEMLGWYRSYARLHLRLFPYLWTHATNLAKDGRPIQRPLGLAYPELGVHPSDTYLLGDALLVAPVLERGVKERNVLLPPGRWIDWWTGQIHEGGKMITTPAPLGTLPLFLREGEIVPLLRPTIDTLSPTTKPESVDSYATTPGLIYARIAAGEASTFTLFDGAELSQSRVASKVTLGSKDGKELAFGVVWELIAAGKKPASVTEGGAPLAEKATLAELTAAPSGWTFSAETGGTVHVKVGAGAAHRRDRAPL